ncbi:MAG: alpha/beta hydrolase [Pseudomonadota bacterium]|nr:alpha/beta hydrolase [Pseudomonadota bacterium]
MLTSLLTTLLLAYGGFAALLFLFQDRLAYYPEIGREIHTTPREHGMAFEALTLDTADGERLDAWFVPAPQARGVVLFLHGNAGNMAHRMDSIAMFHRLGYGVLIFDYRGYGRSSGKPSEAGLYLDAETAWAHLTGQRGIAPGRVVLFGESLGGAVAARLAAQQPPREQPGALVLASVFTSVPDLAADLYPWLPARWLARLRYDTAGAMAKIHSPVLVAHSPDDEIVPFHHGEKLFQAAPAPKVFLRLAGGHNDGFIFMRPEWVEALAGFLREHVERR